MRDDDRLEGGDPPCWSHLLDDEGRIGEAHDAANQAASPDAGEPEGASDVGAPRR